MEIETISNNRSLDTSTDNKNSTKNLIEGWRKLDRILAMRDKSREAIIARRIPGHFIEDISEKEVPFSSLPTTKCAWIPVCEAHNAFRAQQIPRTACRNFNFTIAERMLFEQPNCKIRSNGHFN